MPVGTHPSCKQAWRACGNETTMLKPLVRMTMKVHLLLITIQALGCSSGNETFVPGSETNIPNPLVVDITGKAYEWHIRYPGPDGLPDTADDHHALRDLALPALTDVRLQLHSRDYLYTFTLPHLDLKEIAIPDLMFHLEFNTGPEGIHELLGDQMCGYSHPKLMGKLNVVSHNDFNSLVHIRSQSGL